MIRSPISMSDWIPAVDPGDVQSPGAFTGFGTFGVDPENGGIVDSRGAFNPAFNGQTQHPMFDAETMAFKSVLPGLARRARAGDSVAAREYQSIYGSVAARKKIYDIAWSTGLNDRNATDLMNHVFTEVTPEKFGGGTDQFRTERVRYLAKQAQRRGANVEDILASEQRMSDAFRTSFTSSLSAATGVKRAGGLREIYGASEGMMESACLFLKKGLSEWESQNGLRSDGMRTAIMARAAEYYAKCKANPGLRPLGEDAMSVIEAAASDVGAKAGARGRNPFDDYSRAVDSLDHGFVTATGSVEGDRLLGDGEGPGRAVWAVKDAYAKAIGRNVSAGRGAMEFDKDSEEQLRADLAENLGGLAPNAKIEAGFGGMMQDLVNRVVEDGRKGRINLSDVAGMYYSPTPNPSEAFKPSVALQFREELSSLAERYMTEYVGKRSTFRNTVTSKGFMNRGTEPEYNREFLAEQAKDEIGRWSADPRFAKFASENPEFMGLVTDMITDYADNANNVADPREIGGKDFDEYRTGVRDRINALYMGMELRRRGVNVDGWTPGVKGEDEAVRGNGAENLKAVYGGLLDAAKSWLAANPAAPTDDEGFHNWHFINSVATGLGYKLQSGTTAAPDTPEGRRAADYAKLFDAYAGSGLEAARKSADAALSVKQARDIRESSAVPRAGTEAQNKALRILSEGMFSDMLDPLLARRADTYAMARMAGLQYLSSDVRKLFADRYQLGIMALMRQAMREHPELPMSAWSTDSTMYRRLDELSAPLFADAARMSQMLGAAKMAEFEEKGEISNKLKLQAKAEAEAQGLN